ncbi:OLC1v1032172C1 [Oldenlandia corymbosa var. corymbosa]|uniref:OLC1v1032172C1 n=1 Tax=Oldenlandia corymbosa var. corymbosa TaxID=529605 RepID=A0AAV1CN13_OLDCO|nr:OLC1v1032172C1 [Oldenlandia corymbosa var. corymbosa]
MGSSSEQEHLNRILVDYLNSIHETLQVLDQTAASSLEKVSWNQVVQVGEQLSREATMVGMLWTGEKPQVKSLEEIMASFFNTLQGFLLLAHGSTVGAGPTLASCIHTSAKQVVDRSFTLMKESVSSFGSLSGKHTLPIPELVGSVWESCSALKKTPSTNVTAIGRAMTQVTVSIKDVLREMKELKEASSDPREEINDEAPGEGDGMQESDADVDADDLGNDLSPEDMKIAQATSVVVSEILVVINKLIRSIVGLLKQETQGALVNSVDSLERLVKFCQHVETQIEELGACLYPPQEIPVMKTALGKISATIDEIQVGLEQIGGSSEDFVQACTNLKSLMRQLDLELGCSNAIDLVSHIESLGV